MPNNQWNVGEAPKEDDKWYLLYHEDFIVPIFGRFDGVSWRDDMGRLLRRAHTHWMPRPEDPDGK